MLRLAVQRCSDIGFGSALLRDVCGARNAKPLGGERTVAKLSHVDDTGRARMVDVGDKTETVRSAKARASVELGVDAFSALVARNGMNDAQSDVVRSPKGDVLGVARIAAIQAAKRTHHLIPLCHAVPLDVVHIDFSLDRDHSRVQIVATARTSASKTGVEMEALTAASVAALTIYDMCKAVSKAIRITDV
eukprot:CAMPEP_0185832616 /NCGR_PEP_ID=MMETSP1353-20130828/2186_1 /TAXON_ID=1077150 /ORGANISM="Erythrolobus australicus, Strain CCMP3124" /LENGTH=190 /DNA_ID=CAMNT_0028530809 /DNA_START=546 /DNA_END=1118 /DNA_ORIENTATION=-